MQRDKKYKLLQDVWIEIDGKAFNTFIISTMQYSTKYFNHYILAEIAQPVPEYQIKPLIKK